MKKINELITNAKRIVVLQADNPDGDSLSSSLALEHILGDMGKDVSMYCGVDIPGYLRYLEGWDRIVSSLPTNFDLSIILDTPSLMLFETLQKDNQISWLSSKPCVVLDHHQTEPDIDFATVTHSPKAVATTEVIYELAKHFGWPINAQAAEFLISGILSDSLGLTTEDVSAKSIRAVADLVDKGVNLAELDSRRRKLQKKSPRILEYKGKLLGRIEYEADQSIAIILIPWEEIEKFSHEYNPPMLVLDEMRQVEKVKTAIAFKLYPDGRITAKIRSNFGSPIAAKLAEHFGGGGHKYASGFRITDGRSYDKVKEQTIKITQDLLEKSLK